MRSSHNKISIKSSKSQRNLLSEIATDSTLRLPKQKSVFVSKDKRKPRDARRSAQRIKNMKRKNLPLVHKGNENTNL
jgi:hypothetical protein